MIKLELQKNNNFVRNLNGGSNSGFVILFATTLASIIFSIALGVANVAWKELRFGSSARDANNAFFAADTGVECALVHDKDSAPFGTVSSINCAGRSIAVTGSAPSWRFVVTGLGSAGNSCAVVTVTKSPSGPNILSTIVSKGFNTGDSSCASTSENRVERELRVSY
ncbi:hypothetical protein A3D42_01410 [Candidatus Nomurabacteria bacterium RIFCSPHIGHO2_02_FULL_41_18]|uniref:Type 4 fimbrial biogenesis protein PilX N-terminal domain-containing protein n=1 Tax=Candidatus Nomurabacteria bacterium RIFCSPHIGHO2_02_FULL_41_18 TaxID=1801754 RepID=A0A1F6W7I6_9BACT|nr:MAG: hypothetical protein A2737_00390 [Candidatus Nomurabacteria bacterium RIFCSPHIGHO2_01_FULL_41_71]OGI77851.1 MAG: hypothetical protein A3D42_01410 [Candidatus Nomurabacteria bacterium RIFCSPHIGHO2_02_FULL_41_18]OGI90045.1 MAG: hypothetical protein A3B01_02220 [Candidatus Nomurabacteria bacterium RIFCSPLOWO2_01_FULL_41_52b]